MKEQMQLNRAKMDIAASVQQGAAHLSLFIERIKGQAQDVSYAVHQLSQCADEDSYETCAEIVRYRVAEMAKTVQDCNAITDIADQVNPMLTLINEIVAAGKDDDTTSQSDEPDEPDQPETC